MDPSGPDPVSQSKDPSGAPDLGKRPGESLALRCARLIAYAVIQGKFSPDHPLPVEADLMRQFDVSRNVVRDAVKMLAGKGLLTTTRRAGTFIQPRRKWNLLDTEVLAWTMDVQPRRLDTALLSQLTEIRHILEPEIAALAAQHATVTEMLRIHEAYDDMEQFIKDEGKAIEADIRFHERLFEATHNDLLCSLFPALGMLLRANFELSIHSPDGFIRNLDEHRLVAEAIRERRPDAAREAMRRLLRNNEGDIAAMLDERGGAVEESDRCG